MMFDLWPVYSGERFRASGPSCVKAFYVMGKMLNGKAQSYLVCGQVLLIHHI